MFYEREELKAVIKNCLDSDGLLKNLPSKRRMRFLALQYISYAFEPERRYSEKEVNAVINTMHSFGDYFILRRELIEGGFLARTKNGSEYWLVSNTPDAAKDFISRDA